jgi:hypothetical protein
VRATGGAAECRCDVSAVPGRTFAAVVLGWYGGAVPDPRGGTKRLRTLVERLNRSGVEVILISHAGIDQVDRQLGARPEGPGGLSVLARGGSGVYRVCSDAVVPADPPPPQGERVGPTARALDLMAARGIGPGLHLAAMGGLWQAFAQGFLGIVPTRAGLRIDPRLPDQWPRAGLRFRFHGSRVRLTVDGPVAQVECERAIRLLLPDETVADTRRAVLRQGGHGWTMARGREAGPPLGRSARD